MGSYEDDINYIKERYKKKLKEQLGENDDSAVVDDSIELSSREYDEFRQDILPAHFGAYEKMCNAVEKIIKIAPDKQKRKLIEKSIRAAHLNITPEGAASLAIVLPVSIIFLGILLTVLLPGIMGLEPSLFFLFFFVIFGLLSMQPLQNMPVFLANSWRLRASNQMVLSVFYIVTFMRHTSNLELAVRFAGNHLSGPLALDFRKILWDVETGSFSSIKESIDNYLENWRETNLEFVESVHLIESSLYEADESRRVELLDKALDVMLDETYEKMLHYAHNLKSPITSLHMLGIIMPILGLVILPLIVNFMENIKWYHIALIYNVAIPALVFYLGKNILASRPTGYGDTDITESIPYFKKFKNIIISFFGKELYIKPAIVSFFLFAFLMLLALSPLIAHKLGVADFGFGVNDDSTACGKKYCFFDYQDSGLIDEKTDEHIFVGPFGIGSTVMSLFFPLAFGLSVGLYNKLGTDKIIKIREKSKKLEKEFASALFQLGNRLGDGLPAEIAFSRAAEAMDGTTSGEFFNNVSINIQKQGMSVSEAIFNQKHGAIISFPSKIIESSMKVLTQAVKKSPRIAAEAIINVARYIREMHRVNERLKDLLADIIASMKSQISLLAPAIAGVVVGISSMITSIIAKLIRKLPQAGEGMEAMPSTMMDMFKLGIPPYFFQIIVGMYVVQIIYILTVLSNGIENGSDKLNEKYLLGKNLIGGTIKYVMISGIITVLFTIIAVNVINNAVR